MRRIWPALIAGVAMHFMMTGAASADDAAEKYIDDALQYLYHSCESVVEEAEGDESYIDTVVRALVAVSLYNHEIDIADHATTEEEKAVLRDRFIEAVGNGCEEDEDALLAGVIDDSVVHALSME
jgi:hypothetical protein